MDLGAIKRLARRRGYLIHQSGKVPSYFFIGETHDEQNLASQEMFIGLLRPRLVLHEGAKPEYLGHPDLEGRQEYLRRLFSWRQKYGIRLRSPDIPFSSRSKKDREDLIKSIDDLFNEFRIPKKQVQRPSKSRMKIMSVVREELIYRAIMREKERPLLVILGRSHIDPHSVLVDKLRKNGSSFILFYPRDYHLQKSNDYARFYR